MPAEWDDEYRFEHAYYTNSYPHESSKAKSVQSCIKVLVFIAILAETFSLTGIGLSFAKY